MKYLFLASLSFCLMNIGCDNSQDVTSNRIVEVSLNIPNIEIFYDVSSLDNGRVAELPEGFAHPLGGQGTVVFTKNDGAVISIEFDGKDFQSQRFGIPVGIYDISIEFTGLNQGAAREYFPFSAKAIAVDITESTISIDLQGSSDYDLVIVSNINLCSDFVGWDVDGSGDFGNSTFELKPVYLTTDELYYYFYVHKDNSVGQNYGNVIIYYLSAEGNCNEIKFQLDPVGSKIHYFSVNTVSSSNINLDLDSFWEVITYKFDLG